VLLKLCRFFLYLALFGAVFVLPSTAQPFAGEYYFFRVAIELSLSCLVLWWGFQAPPGALKERLARTVADPLFRAVSLFVLAFVAACLFAYDPSAAFWSGYVRGDGGFQMLHNYAFFVLLLVAFDTAKDWRRALTFTVLAAGLCIAYGILAAGLVPNFMGYTDKDGLPSAPTFFGRLFSDTRFKGSLNNPLYVAITLLFAMAFALYLAFSSQWKSGWGKRLFYSAGIFILLLFFVLTQARGPLLGLLAGAASFFGYLAFADARYRRRAAGGILILAALVIVAFSARNFLSAQNIPGHRLLQADVREVSVRGRFLYWDAAWRGFQERPLLGWGPENFATVLDRHFDPRIYLPGAASETWIDRAHSVVFDYLAETGLLGLAAYTGVFAVFYRQLFRSERRWRAGAEHSPSQYTQALFFAVPVAYLVQGLVFFDVLTTYLNLFLFLGLSARSFRCQD
jgi:O-antigen ligase